MNGLKIGCHGNTAATCLDLFIAIESNKFIYKLYDKKDKFNFKIV